MAQGRLKNAPLKEVIFELFWECQPKENGNLIDVGYETAQETFKGQVSSQYPIHLLLRNPEEAHFMPFVPVHRYMKEGKKFPILQHGPGVLVMNDTDSNYSWNDSFKPQLLNAIDLLKQSYNDKINFNSIRLQYVDAVDVAVNNSFDFVKKNLQTDLIINYEEPGRLRGFNISKRYILEDKFEMSVSIHNAINKVTSNDAVIWTTVVTKRDKHIDDLNEWIEKAHSYASSMFKQMLSKEYYDTLL